MLLRVLAKGLSGGPIFCEGVASDLVLHLFRFAGVADGQFLGIFFGVVIAGDQSRAQTDTTTHATPQAAGQQGRHNNTKEEHVHAIAAFFFGGGACRSD